MNLPLGGGEPQATGGLPRGDAGCGHGRRTLLGSARERRRTRPAWRSTRETNSRACLICHSTRPVCRSARPAFVSAPTSCGNDRTTCWSVRATWRRAHATCRGGRQTSRSSRGPAPSGPADLPTRWRGPAGAGSATAGASGGVTFPRAQPTSRHRGVAAPNVRAHFSGPRGRLQGCRQVPLLQSFAGPRYCCSGSVGY